MSKERVEQLPSNYESHRRRLICSSKEEKHIHSRVCYQRIRGSRGSRGRRRWLELQKIKRIQERVGVRGLEIQAKSVTLEFSERRMNIPGSRVRVSNLEFSDKGLDLLDEMRRKGARRFRRIVPFKPRILPGPRVLPREGDQPVEFPELPKRRRAA